MKLLKIEGSCGLFLADSGEYKTVDKISKDDILKLVNLTLTDESAEFEPYNEENIQNQAHQIIYRNIVEKLQSLRDRRQEFKDESQRLFLTEYQKYLGD